jgi:hypothetical protein
MDTNTIVTLADNYYNYCNDSLIKIAIIKKINRKIKKIKIIKKAIRIKKKKRKVLKITEIKSKLISRTEKILEEKIIRK